MKIDSSTATESMYVVRGDLSPQAIAKSLEALLPARHRPIVLRRFTVLDTFDSRIRRAGARLTSSGVNGTSTVTWEPRGGGKQLGVRLTQPVSFVWDLPDGPLQQVLAPVIGVRRLLAQTDGEEYGWLLEILDDRGKTVGRLRIESGRARLPMSRRVWHPLPTVITLTGLRGYEDRYAQLVSVIESRPGIEACPEGLHGVTLKQIGAPPGGSPASPFVELASKVRADVGARQIHLSLLGLLSANEPGLRANLDTEFLHDFRVAIRRMRSLLGQIRHVFAPSVVEHFSTEFSWIGRLTGPLRDMDVLMLALREHRRDLPDGDMELLTAALHEVQQQEHRRLVEVLDSDRYQRLLSEWRAFLERQTPFGPEARNAGRLLAEVVLLRAWRLSRRIARGAESVDEHTTAERLHALRIDAKKLRYLVDVTPTLYEAADLERILSALKKLQRVLGDFNDAQAQEKRLLECGRAMSAAGAPAGVLLTVGRLAEQSRQRSEHLRGQVVAGLTRFCANDTRSACRRAFQEPSAAERAR